jgi:hypothetical protein
VKKTSEVAPETSEVLETSEVWGWGAAHLAVGGAAERQGGVTTWNVVTREIPHRWAAHPTDRNIR